MMRGSLHLQEPMSRYTSWRVGGAADRLYRPKDLADLQAYLQGLTGHENLYFVGLGSNILVRDGGIRGTVILMVNALTDVVFDGTSAYVEAGVASPKLAKLAAHQQLSGMEFLAGIPGTVGGALAMNAGCHGCETWDIVTQVRTIDRQGVLHERTPDQFKISYRKVVMPAEEWFVGAWFRLQPGLNMEVEQKIRALLAKRLATQPLNLPNSGSVFCNPPGDHAARLIETCGLKGYRVGDAQVSEKHANFIVNLGQASASDVLRVVGHIQRTVRQEHGLDLQLEVRVIGEDPS